jgi:hypothetical protein
MVLLAVAGVAYGAVKLSQRDTQRIEDHTGESVEELSEEDLVAAMKELGIESIDLSDEDRAALNTQGDQAKVSGATITYQGQPQYTPPPATDASAPTQDVAYLDELERLADLRDRGIISHEEFEAKKREILNL